MVGSGFSLVWFNSIDSSFSFAYVDMAMSPPPVALRNCLLKWTLAAAKMGPIWEGRNRGPSICLLPISIFTLYIILSFTPRATLFVHSIVRLKRMPRTLPVVETVSLSHSSDLNRREGRMKMIPTSSPGSGGTYGIR